MQQSRRKHHRVALKEIHCSPAKGIYITKDEARTMGGYAILLFFILLILAIFPRKN